MPKRKVKEEKPKRKMSRKQILIPPIAIGAATLAGLLIMQLVPPPNVLAVCLKAHNVESFNLHPRIELIVNGDQKFLPENVGKQPKEGQECIRPIHTDEVGDSLHIEFVRPIRLSLADFMKIYSYDNKTIEVVENSTGKTLTESIELANYDVSYSYFSEQNQFTPIEDLSKAPPFTSDMLARIELSSK